MQGIHTAQIEPVVMARPVAHGHSRGVFHQPVGGGGVHYFVSPKTLLYPLLATRIGRGLPSPGAFARVRIRYLAKALEVYSSLPSSAAARPPWST